MELLNLRISGMGCGDCATKAETLVFNVVGVVDCTVSFARKQAIIEYNTTKTTQDRIQKALAAGGFRATPLVA